jgi:predicted GNAT family acetyltransferase
MSTVEPTRPDGVDQAVTVENNEGARRFEARTPEGMAELRYLVRGGDTLVLIHTEVPPALQGRGIAGLLARAALEWARARGLKVVPKCPYVRAFIERHPEFQDLVRQ